MKLNPFKTSVLLFALPLISAPLANADWETDVKIQGLGHKAAGKLESGKAYMKGAKLRMDSTSEREGPMSILFNHDAKVMTTLQHNAKMAIEMDMGQLSSMAKGKEKDLMTNCNPKGGATKCLQQMGYKKSGSEKVNGFDCEIYESTGKDGDSEMHHTRLWHPKGMEEVPAVRVVRKNAQGQLVQQIDFLNLKTKSLPDSLFAVPADYKKQDMAAMMKGFSDMFKKMGDGSAQGGQKKGRKGKPAAAALEGAEAGGGQAPQMPQMSEEQAKQMKDAMSQFKKAMEEARKHQQEQGE